MVTLPYSISFSSFGQISCLSILRLSLHAPSPISRLAQSHHLPGNSSLWAFVSDEENRERGLPHRAQILHYAFDRHYDSRQHSPHSPPHSTTTVSSSKALCGT